MLPPIVPARFLIIIAHLVTVITILWSRNENIKACLPIQYTAKEYNSKDVELIVGLSVALALMVLELLGFFSGITMFAPTTCLTSILAHTAACVSLSYFVLDEWDCELYWWIFGFCSALPAIVDFTVIFGVVVLKK